MAVDETAVEAAVVEDRNSLDTEDVGIDVEACVDVNRFNEVPPMGRSSFDT